MVQTDFFFNLVFFKRFLKLCKWMFPSVCSKAAAMTIFLLLLSLLEQVLIYYIGLIPSGYYEVLGNKDKDSFTTHTVNSVLLILAKGFISSVITYVASMLYLTWRGTLCRNLHAVYFRNILYYHVNVVDKSIDNPDQRITQDVDRLTSTFSTVLVALIISPFKIGYYTYQAFIGTGYIGPVTVLAFFIVFTIINKLLMSPVVQYVYQQERKEGDFRFKHMQLRVNAESAAFYHAGHIEEDKTNHKLNQLLATQRRLVHWQFPLNYSINAADYLGSIISYIAIAFPIFLGQYNNLSPVDLSAFISKNSFVTMYLINCFTNLIDLANSVTTVAGTAHRIGQFVEVLGLLKAEQEENCSFHSEDTFSVQLTNRSARQRDAFPEREMLGLQPAFTLESVTYGPPKSTATLCRNLTLMLQSGSNVLVTGDSGCGKTSLLRVICGLWTSSSGTISLHVRQGPAGVLYLPQKPYLTNGCLRDQIIFPVTEAQVVPDDEKIFRYLSLVGLTELLDRSGGLDADLDWNWYDELSPGEMQRLSFVRLFFHNPPFAILDEATSQVSQDMEATLYQTCDRLCICLLSVGHRDSIRQFHHSILHLDGSGGWSFKPVAGGGGGGGGSSGGGDVGDVTRVEVQDVQLTETEG